MRKVQDLKVNIVSIIVSTLRMIPKTLKWAIRKIGNFEEELKLFK